MDTRFDKLPFEQVGEDSIKENIITENNKDFISNIKIKTNDKVFKIQLILIIVWAVLTTTVYFFGYPLIAPLIKIN